MRALQWFSVIGSILLLVVLFEVPGSSGIIGTNLDDSYPLVLEDALIRGSVYGTEIIYTHGPLGYLLHPVSLGNFTVQRHLYAILRALFGFYLIWAILLRSARPVQIALLLWLIMYVARFTALSAAVAVVLMNPPARLWQRRAERWLLPAVCGFAGMAKFTDLLSGVFVIAGASAVLCHRRQWVGAAQALGSFFIAAILAWIITGQPLDALPAYCATSWQIAIGFATMSIQPDVSVLVCGLVGVGILFTAAGLAIHSSQQRIVTMLALIPILGCAFLSWKHGFVRADNHVTQFFVPLPFYCALMFVGLPQRTWWQHGTVMAALAIAFAGLAFARGKLAANEFTPGPDKWIRIAQSLVADKGTARTELERKHATAHEQGALPTIKSIVDRAAVDIVNYRQAVAYINGLELRSRPVIQSFAAYTPRLQEINLQHYLSGRAPGLVLQRLESVDGRWLWLDDAPLLLHLLTDWNPIAREKEFLLLEKNAAGPVGEWRDLGSAEARWGEPVELGDQPPATLVALILDHAPRSVWGRLKRFAYQGVNLRLDVNGRRLISPDQTFVPEMASHGVLISPFIQSADDILAWKSQALPDLPTTSFVLRPPAGHEKEFGESYRYRLRRWIPHSDPDASRKQQRTRSLLYPFLPGVPSAITPGFTTRMVNGEELGFSPTPSAVHFLVPADAIGLEGRMVVLRRNAAAEDVGVIARLVDRNGTIKGNARLLPGAGAIARVNVAMEFAQADIAAGGARLELEARSPGGGKGAVADIVWGPMKWKRTPTP